MLWLAKTKQQREAFEARCVELLNKWAVRLDLEGWDLDSHFLYDEEAKESEHFGTDLLVGAFVSVEPQYRRARVNYQVPDSKGWVGVGDDELNTMLLHELIHVVLGMYSDLGHAAMNRRKVSREHFIFANEFTTSWLTAIVRRGYEPPSSPSLGRRPKRPPPA